jgi:hypothetical protein
MTLTEESIEEIEQARREKWLSDLHDLYEFYEDNPSLIPAAAGAVVTEWLTGDKVRQIAEVAGPLRLPEKDDGRSYVALRGPEFGPHHVTVYADRREIGSPVLKTKTVTEYEWDPELCEVQS